MKACEQPIDEQALVDYWAGDLTDAERDALDEHLIGCGPCTERSARIAAVSSALRAQTPLVLRARDLSRLAARGMRIVENSFSPNDRREVHFPGEVDVLVHRLTGIELQDAVRVTFSMQVEGTQAVLGEVEDAPFDREAGAILVACRRHYAVFPSDTVARVRVHGQDGSGRDYQYTLLHRFAR